MGYLCLGITFQQQLISGHVVYMATDKLMMNPSGRIILGS